MQTANEQVDILLVDDRPENLMALEAVLENPEYRLIKAESGDNALRYLLENEPALILMDVQMPNLDGFETASIIKKSERTRDIPIIFLTAINKDERYVHQGYFGGAVDYIAKPFDDQILRAKVSVFVDLYRKTQRMLKAEHALRENERFERERKLRELELTSLLHDQLQQQKYRELVSDIEHAIVWTAEPTTMTFSFISPSAEKILGYPLTDWVTNEIFVEKCEVDEHKNAFRQAVRDLREGKQTETTFEHCCKTVDGKVKWFQTSMRIRRKGQTSVNELRGLSTDITKLKEAEAVLTEAKKKSEMLSEASFTFAQAIEIDSLLKQVGAWVVPNFADWCILDTIMNENEIELLSITHSDPAEEKVLRNYLEQNPRTKDSKSGAAMVIKSGQSQLITENIEEFVPSELSHLFKNRSALVVPLRARGATLGALTLVSSKGALAYDQSDLDFAEQLASRIALTLDNARLFRKATEAIHVRDEFLSVASHELRTPLTALTLQIQLLYRNMKNGVATNYNSDKIADLTQGTNRQLKRLCRLLDDLLDVTRISQGKLSLNYEPGDLVQIVREVSSRFEQQLKSAGCSLELKLHDEPIIGEWDTIRIEQVVSNLLTNAMKYGAGKPIEIECSVDNHLARIKVCDHGVGISREDQKRIFDRFERAISAKEVSGLGLGLYIVSQILSAHKGHIGVESEIGNGSTFTVELPLRPEAAVAKKPIHSETASRVSLTSLLH